MRILLTGATGYIGGRLLPELEASGAEVRCMARRPEYLRSRVGPGTEVVAGDVLDPDSLRGAMEGVHTAYYLVHSMGGEGCFEETDLLAARNFAAAAEEAGVRRIIYLGGLGRGDDLSEHLESRQAVGRVLRESSVPTVEFRASIIIGSGSFSFQMIAALVEKLPVMVTPRWVETRAQPIAVEDVIAYLRDALAHDVTESIVYEIGGEDVVSYGEIMRVYARMRKLRRWMIRVPFLTPWLSSLWLGLVTPLYARVGRKLIEGVRNPTVVTDDRARRDFAIEPRGIADAIERALRNEDRRVAATLWSDALSSAGTRRRKGEPRYGRRIVDSQVVRVRTSPESAFTPIRRLGGRQGWYFATWLWRVRGFLDLLFGGPGMRRGRRDPERLAVGDALDFWRVEAYEPDRLLRLSAEMRVPGRAWLQYEVSHDRGATLIRQTAVFDPLGLSGRLYWYLLYPIHQVIFRGTLYGIARRAA